MKNCKKSDSMRSRDCGLCLEELNIIIFTEQNRLLNKKSEFIGKCQHKYLLISQLAPEWEKAGGKKIRGFK